MKIGIPKERRPEERRVAASPDTAKRLKGMGHDILVEKGAGTGRRLHRRGLCRRGRDHGRRGFGPGGRDRAQGAGALARRGRQDEDGRGADRHAPALAEQGSGRGLCQGGAHRLRHGAGAAHHPRPGDGRAVLAGQSRRLQGRARRRRRLRPRHADDDDRGRHDSAGARAGDGRGRRRPAGDRHGAASGRDRLRHRCPLRRQGAGRKPGRHLPRRRSRGDEGDGDGGRLCQGGERGFRQAPARARDRGLEEDRHRHLHRAHPRAQGAGADHQGDGGGDACRAR